MKAMDYAAPVLKEIGTTLAAISPEEAERLVDLILGARRIMVAGAGRSGLAVRAFAMRLMHLGLDAYVVGETVTPNFEAEDLAVIGSGSGETASLVAIAGKAKRIGGKLALLSIFPESSIGRLADLVVRIPAVSPKAGGGDGTASIQPMGALFEQSLLILTDLIVLRLMERRSDTSASMFGNHANLE
jgi:6-phospho-3-hexuloisomerase